MSHTGHVQNGVIVFDVPNTFPDGTLVKIEAIETASNFSDLNMLESYCDVGLTEEEWRDDPDSIAAWIAEVRSIERPEYSAEERAELARYREESRRFNLEAVRQQMEARDQP